MAFLTRILTGLLGLPARIKFYLALAVIIAGAVFVAVTYFTNLGYQEALNDVRDQDQSAVDAANDAADAVLDCLDTGGVYDQSTGVCRW